MYEAILKQLSVAADRESCNRALTTLGTPEDVVVPEQDKAITLTFLKLADQAEYSLTTAFQWLAKQEQSNNLATILLSDTNQKKYLEYLLNQLLDKLEIESDDRQVYAALLKNLGSDTHALLSLNENDFAKLKDIVDSLALLKKTLADSGAQTFIFHAEALCQLKAADLNLNTVLISEKNRRLNARLNAASMAATYAYAVMTALSAVELAVGIPLFTIWLQLWNYVDTGECVAEADQQYQQDEIAMARENVFAGGQMVLATGLVSVKEVSELAGHPLLAALPAVACSLLLGISFAISYGFCWHMEETKVQRSNQEITTLETALEAIEKKIKENKEPILLPILTASRDRLDTHLLIAKARRQDQQNSALAFKVCFFAMVAAVAVAYVGLSVLSCGGLPLAMLIVASAIFATSGFRIAYTRGVSHSDLAQQSLAPPAKPVDAPVSSWGWLYSCFTGNTKPLDVPATNDNALPQTQPSLHQRLMTCLRQYEQDPGILPIDLNEKVAMPGRNFFKATMTLKQYLYDLQFKNPDKLGKLLDCLTPNYNADAFGQVLAEKRLYWPADTLGQKIFKQLTPKLTPPTTGNSGAALTTDTHNPLLASTKPL